MESNENRNNIPIQENNIPAMIEKLPYEFTDSFEEFKQKFNEQIKDIVTALDADDNEKTTEQWPKFVTLFTQTLGPEIKTKLALINNEFVKLEEETRNITNENAPALQERVQKVTVAHNELLTRQAYYKTTMQDIYDRKMALSNETFAKEAKTITDTIRKTIDYMENNKNT